MSCIHLRLSIIPIFFLFLPCSGSNEDSSIEGLSSKARSVAPHHRGFPHEFPQQAESCSASSSLRGTCAWHWSVRSFRGELSPLRPHLEQLTSRLSPQSAQHAGLHEVPPQHVVKNIFVWISYSSLCSLFVCLYFKSKSEHCILLTNLLKQILICCLNVLC